jgi:uncharacterized membrane protein
MTRTAEAGPPRPPRPTELVVPSRTDPFVRAASTAVGGPWGRHGVLGQRRLWTPLRVLLAMTVFTLMLAWVQKAPCRDGAWEHGLQYTHFCYSDVIPLYFTEKLNEGAIPYADHAVEYPVLTGGFMFVAAWLAHRYDSVASGGLLPDLPAVQTYFTMTALLLAACMLVVTWSTAALAGRRVWDAAMVALSPLVIVHAFTNWDLFAVALAGAALVAWQRRHPALAGVLLGLGAAAKLYPALFLVPLFVLCLRTRRLGAFVWTLGAATLAWVAVNLPIAALFPESWRRFFELNRTRPADFDTVWYGVKYLLDRQAGTPNEAPQVNLVASVVVLLALVAVAALGLLARRRPRLPQLLFLAVAAFLLTNKVWSPQYSLWLVPLAVLARPSWRAYLAWQATEVLVWFPRLLWFLGTGDKGVDYPWFLLAVSIRDVALVVYCLLVVRDIVQPDRDLVRSSGVDDPAGGVLDGAPDDERVSAAVESVRAAWRGRAPPAGSAGGDSNASGDRRNTT